MSVVSELRRRNLYRAAALYAATGWLAVQIATQVFPVFDLPESAVRVVVVAAVLGFPFAMLYSWYYGGGVAAAKPRKRLDRWIIASLSLAVALLLFEQFAVRQTLGPRPTASVAVLPFANASGDADDQFFSEGLSDDLINALTQFGDLKVISRNSSFQFQGSADDSRAIGEKLGVAHLVEGSVRRVDDSVRVSVQLVTAADGATVWSKRYVRPYRDLLTLQNDIISAVADELKVALPIDSGAVRQSDHPPSGNVDAYSALLQGNFYATRGNEQDYRKALGFYTTATTLDPNYALAHANLARQWINLSRKYHHGDEASQAYARAREAIDTALTVEPELAAAHRVQGTLLESDGFDWAGAMAAYRRALALAPNDSDAMAALGGLLATLGEAAEAVDLIERAIESNPLCASCYHWLSRYLRPLNRLDEAEDTVREAMVLSPNHAGYATTLTTIAIMRGDAELALAAAQQEVAEGGWQLVALAFAQQLSDNPAEADAALNRLIDAQADEAAYQIAQTYALRNNPDMAFEWLDRAWENGDAGVSALLYDGILLKLANDPRFTAFCDKAGLPRPPYPGISVTPL